MLSASHLRALWAVAGAGAIALVAAAAVTRRPSPLLSAVALLAAAYGARLIVDRAALDLGAPIFGAGLLLGTELGIWSADLDRGAVEEGAAMVARLRSTLVVVLGGLLVSTLALAAAVAPLGRSLVLTALGGAAACAVLFVVARLARGPVRAGGPGRPTGGSARAGARGLAPGPARPPGDAGAQGPANADS